jgi:hypothetical protein
MGEPETSIVTLRDMYDVLIGTRDDVRDLKTAMGGTTARVDDHETRIRTLEANQGDYVTEDDMRDKSGHSLMRTGVVSGLVSTALGLVEFLILHH